MTSRRLFLLLAALLDSAFSLAFWLSDRITSASSAAATELARSRPSDSLPTVRPLGLDGTLDQLGRPARAGRAPISPDAHGSGLYTLPPLASGVGRSNSSRSQQIPLLAGGLKTLSSALQNPVFLTHLERLGRKSLNPSLSLHGGFA
jgi:hypothetical protein